jgi:hypothetical protein
MTKAIYGNSQSIANRFNSYDTVYTSFFKSTDRPQSYQNKTAEKNWKAQRPATAGHPNTRTNFKVGYVRETGLVSTQMQASKQIEEVSAHQNNVEVTKLRKDNQKKQRQTNIQFGSSF